MSRKRRRRNEDVEVLQQALSNNTKAAGEGPKKKSWSRHDLKNIKPLTSTQEEMFHAFFNGYNVCAHGSAGTGKTYIALWLAFNELLNAEKGPTHIIIVRSAVPTRDLGFMPGDLEEKTAFYEGPYRDMLANLFGKFSTYDNMKLMGMIQFLTTSFVRGLTWDNAIVIVDEFQNMTLPEIDSVISRIGENTKIILCGDIKHQCDLKREHTGAGDLIKIVKSMKEFSVIEFSSNDIVRSKFVKNWILAREKIKI